MTTGINFIRVFIRAFWHLETWVKLRRVSLTHIKTGVCKDEMTVITKAVCGDGSSDPGPLAFHIVLWRLRVLGEPHKATRLVHLQLFSATWDKSGPDIFQFSWSWHQVLWALRGVYWVAVFTIQSESSKTIGYGHLGLTRNIALRFMHFCLKNKAGRVSLHKLAWTRAGVTLLFTQSTPTFKYRQTPVRQCPQSHIA